jgi:hypothetical protein
VGKAGRYRIKLLAAGHAAEFMPGGGSGLWIDVDGPKPLREILAAHGVNPDLVMAVFIDGARAGLDAVPQDGAEVLLVSPPAGG